VIGPKDGQLQGIDVDLNAMPDMAQTLAVLALFAKGPSNIRNVANLRIKETDRIAAVANELTKFGARVEARDEGFSITPPIVPQAASVDTYDDHRMAMSFAMAGLRLDGVVIRKAECVGKTFPGFFETFEGMGR
jgi:3-phosphoshikimate 1-carboxyvinyltransferase